MCCGLPVISTTAAGCSIDMIHNGENGYIIKPGDSKELADVITKVINDSNECNNMGKMSLKIINESFSLTNIVGGFIKGIEYSIGKKKVM
jgi:glycosyltransferase involved in cell wall biosynthesis